LPSPKAWAAVVVNGRASATVDRAVTRIREEVPGASVKGVAADAGSVDGADALIAAAPEIDILVNNVGVFEVKPFFEIADADWRRFFETNVMSGVRLSVTTRHGCETATGVASSSSRASRP
jgi:NAD(P)-dependent dehydrogenase (short-subunit alcohol dehydrogenase family)